ncbi:MAG: hypothetical protein U0105_12485 [Candidatus Obscuribacterales bacterium]
MEASLVEFLKKLPGFSPCAAQEKALPVAPPHSAGGLESARLLAALPL